MFNFSKSTWLIILLLIVFIILYFISWNTKAHAWYVPSGPTYNPCQYWQEDKWEADCVTPTVSPTLIPSISPDVSDTPVATPTVMQVPTGIPVPNGDDSGDVNSCLHHDCSGNKVGGADSSNSPTSAPMTGRAQ